MAVRPFELPRFKFSCCTSTACDVEKDEVFPGFVIRDNADRRASPPNVYLLNRCFERGDVLGDESQPVGQFLEQL